MYHSRLFRGPSTNDMKKEDGPSLSWPTPHTTPFFLPPEDPFPVLLHPNSIGDVGGFGGQSICSHPARQFLTNA